MRRRSATLLVLAALAAAGCTFDGDDAGDGEAHTREATRAGLDWSACDEDLLDGLECAELEVPVDHDEPDGPTLSIALARHPATGDPSARIGSLVVNPGGPGASGIELAASLAQGLDEAVLERFDLVGFDPRGVGRSTPVRCIDDPEAIIAIDGDPDNPAEVDALAAERAEVAAACTDAAGDLLPHLGTADAARDLDRIRAALGDDRLTYLGFSYGTELGATYATLFPDRVRAMVLDGAVAPGLSVEELNLAQAKGFEQAFANFAEACRTDTACGAHPDAGAVLDAALARAEAAPLPVTTPGEDRKVAIGTFQTGLIGALYDQTLWGFLGRGLAEAAAGDGTTMLGLADLYTQRRPDGSYPNLAEAFRAISCADEPERATVADVPAVLDRYVAAAPRFGALSAWSTSSCAGWPPGAESPVEVSAPDAPPILVIGTTGDPATPYEWASRLAAVLGPARVLTWEGEGHTAYPKTECVTAAVDAYLLEGTLPADGARCPSGGEPGASPFDGVATELRKALTDSGLPEAIAGCMAAKLAEVIRPTDLGAASTDELSPGLQAQIVRFGAECATGR